jgi:hypothetical protein
MTLIAPKHTAYTHMNGNIHYFLKFMPVDQKGTRVSHALFNL